MTAATFLIGMFGTIALDNQSDSVKVKADYRRFSAFDAFAGLSGVN